MKPIVNISGNLGWEAEVGNRAYIQVKNGENLLTSPVVDVRNKTDIGVEIETRNTIYVIKYSTESLPLAG